MRANIWLLGGIVFVVAVGFLFASQFTSRRRLIPENASQETTLPVEDAPRQNTANAERMKEIRSQAGYGVQPRQMPHSQIYPETDEPLVGNFAQDDEQVEELGENEHDFPKDFDNDFDVRMQGLMQEMDALLSRTGAGMNPSEEGDRQLVIRELEEEIQKLLRSANMPSITREGPNGWTVYANE